MTYRSSLSLAFSLLLYACSDSTWSDQDSQTVVVSCAFSDPLPSGRTPLRAALSGDGGSLYVLDDMSTVYRYAYDELGACRWSLDGDWQSGGSLSLSGFVEDVDMGGSALLWMDGASLGGLHHEQCYAQRGAFAAAPSGLGFAVGNQGGIHAWTLRDSSCSRASPGLGLQPVLALDQDGDGYYAVEGTGTGLPERLVLYDGKEQALWREPFSVIPGEEEYYCSATRLRVGHAGIFLLDAECGRLGVYDVDGRFRKTLDLNALGISSPLDIMPSPEGGLYVLVQNRRELAVRLSSLLF